MVDTTLSRTWSPEAAIEYARQAEKLSHIAPGEQPGPGTAVEAHFITPQDPIIKTKNGSRLPGVPVAEATKLNQLKENLLNGLEDPVHIEEVDESSPERPQKSADGSLRRTMPPSKTNPLFPPLPLYGPNSMMRNLQCSIFRVSSFFLSLAFLGIIVLGSAFTSIPMMFTHIWIRMQGKDPDARRVFHKEEVEIQRVREEKEREWEAKMNRSVKDTAMSNEKESQDTQFVPTEGGKDPLICDVAYYARRVGLDIEEFTVQTEDGFLITLWHVYDPKEFTPLTPEQRAARGPDIFTGSGPSDPTRTAKKPKFPVLMMHGLLQSAGAYCSNDDKSLAFYLCKQGYDVWLGNNRCGFNPRHTLLSYSDPRMWAWNIRQMGVMDLPALTSRVLAETGFSKLGLIAHSQGTTQTFVALAKEQRPDLGDKITVFCALAPAAYAGPLIGKAYFKFMKVITPAMFRLVFGIHAFIPFMMTMHKVLPGKLYGAMGYRVFSFLFDWTDSRWDRGLRNRMFQFAPVYVSAESMRWWLGRECFAKQKCILSTKEDQSKEDREDEMEDYYKHVKDHPERPTSPMRRRRHSSFIKKIGADGKPRQRKGATAWYDEHVPPFALWVAGSDELVDGRRLLRRFERGREPHVRIVHEHIIEEYEHLDVIWAMDVIEKVGQELKEVLWKTCDVRDKVRMPVGCEELEAWVDPKRKRSVDPGADEGSEKTLVDREESESDGEGQSESSDEEEDDKRVEKRPRASRWVTARER
jgi:pimeloyl-ACP methyl ester carboxylesterase